MKDKVIINNAPQVIAEIIPPNENFPNNLRLPLLIYKAVLQLAPAATTDDVKKLLKENGWHKFWVDSIDEDYHYHSNTHEALVIFAGVAKVQIGGGDGKIYSIEKGDLIILPVGVAHKNVGSSEDFTTIGCYPYTIEYDYKHGKSEELAKSIKNIQETPIPKTDPIFGEKGILFKYWR